MISLNYLLFLPFAWLILGAVLLSLELLVGSFVVFLPSGLGAWVTAAALKLQLEDMLFGLLLFSSWSDLLVMFAISTGVSIVLVRYFVHLRKSGTPDDDINQY